VRHAAIVPLAVAPFAGNARGPCRVRHPTTLRTKSAFEPRPGRCSVDVVKHAWPTRSLHRQHSAGACCASHFQWQQRRLGLNKSSRRAAQRAESGSSRKPLTRAKAAVVSRSGGSDPLLSATLTGRVEVSEKGSFGKVRWQAV